MVTLVSGRQRMGPIKEMSFCRHTHTHMHMLTKSSSYTNTIHYFNEFHNFGSDSKLPEPMTAGRTTRHKVKSVKKSTGSKTNLIVSYFTAAVTIS